VEQSVLDSFPQPQDGEEVVVVVASRGGNILEVRPLASMGTDKDTALCLLPSKFKKLVWVRRGTMLIVSSADEDYSTSSGSKGKVKYTVNHILFRDQVKHLMKLGIIPETETEKDDETIQPKLGEKNSDNGTFACQCSLKPVKNDPGTDLSSNVDSPIKKKKGENKITEVKNTVPSSCDGESETSIHACKICSGRIKSLSNINVSTNTESENLQEGISNMKILNDNDEDGKESDKDSYSDLVTNTNRSGGYVTSSDESETESEED